jgi:branched-chain amino acid aminotransferase
MKTVWFKGKLMREPIALDAHDRGLTLGDGVFETVAVIGGKAQWLDRHVQRMGDAALELGIVFSEDEVRSAALSCVACSTEPMEVLRLTLTRGVAARGLAAKGTEPTLIAALDGFDASNMFWPCRLGLSNIRRNEHAPSSRLKTLSYADAIMAAREVRAVADEALMLNTAGSVASVTTGNIFLMKDGRLVTPSLDQGILPGIMRGLVIEAARLQRMAVEERTVDEREMLSADGLFCTNSLRFIRPVSSYDGREKDTRVVEALSAKLKGHLLKG